MGVWIFRTTRPRMMGPDPQAEVSVTLKAVQWDRILDLILVAYDEAPDAVRVASELSAELTRVVFEERRRLDAIKVVG